MTLRDRTDFTVFAELRFADGTTYTLRHYTNAVDTEDAAAIATASIMGRVEPGSHIRLLEVFPTEVMARYEPTGPRPWAVRSL
jgi:hypothetical protein